MKKIKYYYNTNTLRYEKLTTPLRVKLLRFFGVLCAFLVTSTLVIYLYQKFGPKPKNPETLRYELMKDNYAILRKKVTQLEDNLEQLEKRDNEVYRSIFEQNPLPDSARAALINKKKDIEKINLLGDESLEKSIAQQLNNISTRIASGFGFRIHPIYGIAKMHNGLDFTAPQGTPIYATGNGTVTSAAAAGGAGNQVIINHGYGYETVYMHMVRIKASVGQVVKRGEIIGWVGSTGASTGPHCHYEVHINGTPVDPVYFFYNDISADEYDRLLKIAATGSAKSFD